MAAWLLPILAIVSVAVADTDPISKFHDWNEQDRYPLEKRVTHDGMRVQLSGFFKPPSGQITDAWLRELISVTYRGGEVYGRIEIPRVPDQSLANVGNIVAEQYVGPLRVLGGNLIFQIKNGAVIGISGQRVRASRTDTEIATRLRQDSPIGSAWHIDYGPVIERLQDGVAELVDPVSGTPFVRAQSRHEIDTFYEPHTCKIAHNLFDATDMRSWGALINSASGPSSNCGRENYGSICVWELSREDTGIVHQLGQLNDHQSTPATDPYSPCSSPYGAITSTAIDKLRQQNMYYYTERFRSFLFTRMWDKVQRDQQSNMQINIEENACFGGIARFNRYTTDIYINRDRSETGNGGQTIIHEYGHYVNWSYGHFSTFCIPGSDEGNAINETFADLVGLAFVARDSEMNLNYKTSQSAAFAISRTSSRWKGKGGL